MAEDSLLGLEEDQLEVPVSDLDLSGLEDPDQATENLRTMMEYAVDPDGTIELLEARTDVTLKELVDWWKTYTATRLDEDVDPEDITLEHVNELVNDE